MPMSLVPRFDETLRGHSLAIQARQATCRDVFERCKAVVADRESSVKAWVSFGGDDVARVVDERDAELQQGIWRGPLHGDRKSVV